VGTYNNFRPLKDCADKLIKFKQDVSIEVARHRGKIEDAHFEVVKGGICASFVMQWIVQKYTGLRVYNRAKGIKSTEHEGNIKLVTESIPSYLMYQQDYQVDTSVQKLAEEYGLELRPAEKHFERTLEKLAEYYSSQLRAGQAVYIHAYIVGDKSHALGLSRMTRAKTTSSTPTWGSTAFTRAWMPFSMSRIE
jgi:hypothetical protein